MWMKVWPASTTAKPRSPGMLPRDVETMPSFSSSNSFLKNGIPQRLPMMTANAAVSGNGGSVDGRPPTPSARPAGPDRPIHNLASLVWWCQHNDSARRPWHMAGKQSADENATKRVGDEMHRLARSGDFFHLLTDACSKIRDRQAVGRVGDIKCGKPLAAEHTAQGLHRPPSAQ